MKIWCFIHALNDVKNSEIWIFAIWNVYMEVLGSLARRESVLEEIISESSALNSYVFSNKQDAKDGSLTEK